MSNLLGNAACKSDHGAYWYVCCSKHYRNLHSIQRSRKKAQRLREKRQWRRDEDL